MTTDAPQHDRPRIGRALRLSLAMVVVVLAAVGGTWWYIGRVGSTPLERWIGRQIIGAIEQHITPRVTYSDLDYQAPLTVVIDDLALVSGEERILGVHRATLTLAEIPREGRPIRIQTIELYRPILRFVADADGRMSSWTGFARPAPSEPGLPTSRVVDGTDAPASRLSDILVLRRASIRQGRILYDAGEGHPAMILPDIELSLSTPPTADAPGWYECDGHLDRAPQLSLRFDTRINLDTGLLELQDIRLDAALDEGAYATMPPAVQRFLAERHIRGRLVLSASGSVPLGDPAAGELRVEADFDRVYFTLGETAWPAERIDLDFTMAQRRLWAQCDAKMLGGEARLTASLQLEASRLLKLDWRMSNIRLEETLRIARGSPPKYAGRLASQGRLSAALANRGAISGDGRVEVTDGVLVALPVLAELHGLILGGAGAIGIPPDAAATDRGTMDFVLRSEHMDVKDLEVISTLAAIKGGGRVYYDGRLDLTVNAGPLKRLEMILGPIGSLLGTITDRLAPYHIGGTLKSPAVTIRPLGL